VASWQVGNVRVTQIIELSGSPVSPKFLFADLSKERVCSHAWLRPNHANDEGKLFLSIHAFVVESEGRRIVVDTCVGNDKPRTVQGWNQLQGPFLADLAASGYPPETIDTVLCTHMHVDHVGWNTRLVEGRWVPTFVNARYLFARKEWEHFASDHGEDRVGDVIGDSVRPILDAGLADLVEHDHQITSDVWLESTPGHTPGHVSVRIKSQGSEAVITGDVMHHPIQCSEPDLHTTFDFDPDQARHTRRAFLARYCDRPVLVLGTHFAPPTAGWLVSTGEVWKLADGPPPSAT
jgi:glyoxylase-like metal-dependent hydrolase (beta-lactamase superfamily II)